MFDDDEEMRELAEAGEARSLEEQVAELAKTVAGQAEEVKKLKAKGEKRRIWNWWTATDEQKAEWTKQIENWLLGYVFPTFPQMQKKRFIPDCWKLHPDWLDMLGTLYQDWLYVHEQDNPEFKLWWLTKWRKTCTEDWRRESSATACGYDPSQFRTPEPWLHPRMPTFERSAFEEQTSEWQPDVSPVPSPRRRGDGEGPEWTMTMR